jgi:aspartate/methionine/tyrosine aminotransferase
VIPKIFSDKRFKAHVEGRNKKYEHRSNIAYDLLKDIKGIVVNRTNGAFYMTVMFEEGVLNGKQSLPVKDKVVRDLVERITKDVALDKRFVYYLLATTGICVVPLTGFNCNLKGFGSRSREQYEAKFD